MKVYTLTRKLLIPVPVPEAWKFFSNPGNLKRITPPEMNFRILTENLPEKIHPGLMIKYTVTPLFGIKMKWMTEITDVTEPHTFADVQRKGPYSQWHHRHSFSEHKSGTLMTDEVEYALPFSFLGTFAHRPVILKKLNHVFDYRERIISKIFFAP